MHINHLAQGYMHLMCSYIRFVRALLLIGVTSISVFLNCGVPKQRAVWTLVKCVSLEGQLLKREAQYFTYHRSRYLQLADGINSYTLHRFSKASWSLEFPSCFKYLKQSKHLSFILSWLFFPNLEDWSLYSWYLRSVLGKYDRDHSAQRKEILYPHHERVAATF